MIAKGCLIYNQYNEQLRWEFAEQLGSCVYNAFDELAFITGWISVFIWTFALLPQIITNCKNKAAESQSFWFWLLWVIGDFCNFTGCLLTKNLITNDALALVYLIFTAFAFLQWIWYEFILPKYTRRKRRKTFPSISLSPKLLHTLKILSKSPRIISTHALLAGDMRVEYADLQCNLFSEDTDTESIVTNESITPDSNSQNQSIKIYENYDCHLDPLRSAKNPRYGSISTVSTVLSTLSLMSITVVMVYAINTSQDFDESGNSDGQRILLTEIEIKANAEFEALMMMGLFLGWTACFIYASSRVPQLLLMLKTKEVSGINPLFFMLTFTGNLAQSLSMLFHRQIYEDSNHLFSKLPWLLTAGVCMVQDGFILFLIRLYKSNWYKSLSQSNISDSKTCDSTLFR